MESESDHYCLHHFETDTPQAHVDQVTILKACLNEGRARTFELTSNVRDAVAVWLGNNGRAIFRIARGVCDQRGQ